jgi:hypothetical protein
MNLPDRRSIRLRDHDDTSDIACVVTNSASPPNLLHGIAILPGSVDEENTLVQDH